MSAKAGRQGARAKPKHTHTTKCITDAWHSCSGLSYESWIRLAPDVHDQNAVWRTHEFFARKDKNESDPGYIDLGGES